jgi:guanylate kinase
MLKLDPKPFPLVISGPSGVGKTVICQKLLEDHGAMARVVTVTTRLPRRGETPEIDYHFVDPETFERYKREGMLLESARVHDADYGTPWSDVEGHLREGKIALLNVDVQGALVIREKKPSSVLVFILPPDEKTLRVRLKKRGTDDNDTIERRLKRAREEMELAPRYDYVVVNDGLERCVGQILCILRAEASRSGRCLSPESLR